MKTFGIKTSDDLYDEAHAMLDDYPGETNTDKLAEMVAQHRQAKNKSRTERYAEKLALIAKALDVVMTECNGLADDADLSIDAERSNGLRETAEIRRITEELQSKCSVLEAEKNSQSKIIVELQADNAELKATVESRDDQIATLTMSLKVLSMSFDKLKEDYDNMSSAYTGMIDGQKKSSGEVDKVSIE